MKSVLKIFTGMMAGAFALMLALVGPGAAKAEAYTNYTSYTSYSNSSNYSNYSNYTSYNYSNTSRTTTTPSYSNYNTPNYTNYTVYRNTSTPTQTTKPTQTVPSQQTTTPSQSSSGVITAEEQAMLNLINKERAAAGLQPLTTDAKLTQLARMKAQDMIDNNYFAHQSPTYGSPFDMMKNNGVTYRFAGENLAGANDVNTAHKNLMNSPSHKANILKAEYTKVGIGVVGGGQYGKMYVQLYNG
ncbi:CAP domain-containing protein [Desulforamulus aquiferis]|uniref:CAP domain-containing protein n=1 Tax=Desulforamulus aquiferis TaxID=1397668 RepID=A0AAW7ZAF0_9FIRM|nr:CAP domain-containing protein [Desulforamulus aquiferis]MDO7786342.1 CAP domain-containing protein [Desulforamulus aquiferis]RYD06636.1 hypothetical protein N752_02905 [Desulforamulus aquiferis]